MCSVRCCHLIDTVIQTLMNATSLLFLMRMCGSSASETLIYFGWQGIWFLFDCCAVVQAVSSCCQILFKIYSCQTPPKGKVLDVPICFGCKWELKMVIMLEGVLGILQTCHIIVLYHISVCWLCRGTNITQQGWTGLCSIMLSTVQIHIKIWSQIIYNN